MGKLKFKQTNQTCPERYAILKIDGDVITTLGYTALRYGKLRAMCFDKDEFIEIYEASVGDEWTGRFQDKEEREKHFAIIEEKILERLGEVEV